MTGLLTVQVVRAGIRAPVGVEPRPKLRWAVLASTVALWALSLLALLSGWAQGRYLGLILVWGLLPFLLQWSFGGDLLLADWRRLGVAILAPTLYLWLVDAIAIGSGAWIIDPAQTTGVKLGVLPLEEMVFFLVTNLLIVSGITLALSPQSSARWQSYRQRLAGWWGVRVGDDAFSAGD
jgi:lycopene cyclase domain-containing protein